MKFISLITILFALFFCQKQNDMESEILHQLDLSFKGEPNEYYPKGGPKDIKYNFFLDLQHGYFVTAGSRIHLYANEGQWAVVFEKNGYQNRAGTADIELDYVGNCIEYPIDRYPERNYITNSAHINLIDGDEFGRIENKEGSDMETFEMIGKDIKEVKVRGQFVPFNNNYRDYEKVGIKLQDFGSSGKLIGFGDLIRYYQETNPKLISATEEEIKRYIPKDLKKIMTIDKFHQDQEKLPSQQETYRLIAKILVTKNPSYWKPTLPDNNHWSNWDSGNL